MKKKLLLKKDKQQKFLRNFEENDILILRILKTDVNKSKKLKSLCSSLNIHFITFSNKHLKSFFNHSNFLTNFFSSEIIFLYGSHITSSNLKNLGFFLNVNKNNFAILGFYQNKKLYNTSSASLFLKNDLDILYNQLYSTIFLIIFFQFLEFLNICKNQKEI
jgi:hypothetical protein